MHRYEVVETWNGRNAELLHGGNAETMKEAREKLLCSVLQYAALHRKGMHQKWGEVLNITPVGNPFFIPFTCIEILKHSPYCYSITDHTTHSIYSAVFYIRKRNTIP